MKETRVVLVDASPYIFRAYFSLPASMVAPDGAPVGAVYGFASFLFKLIQDEAPTHLGVAFDGSLTTSFRNEIFPAYKAQRELPPPELKAQLDACREVAQALGAQTFVDSRYEADDYIGTLCRRLEPTACPIVVVTPDKDLAQVVTERITLFDFAKGERYDPSRIREKFGVDPEQIPDLLGLAGDSVDNIPGVKGVGKKSAVLLLEEFGTLDDLYERIDEVKALPVRGAPSLWEHLIAGREVAFLSRRLAEVSLESPVEADLVSLAFEGADPRLIDPLFERLGFEALRDRVPRWRTGPPM